MNVPAHCIQGDELQIVRALESDIPAHLDDLFRLLSSDERSRAHSFRFEPDRRRFIFCRSALRRLIGSYIGKPAGEISFEYGRYGKPFASDDSHRIQFNLSHTNGRFLFAFTRAIPVGIDIEAIEPARNWEAIARQFFHPNERLAIASLSPALAAHAIKTIWTCKEAVLKARGDGVGGGLESFEVILPADSGDLAQVRFDDKQGTDEIWLRPLDEGPDFAAAVAVLGRPSEVRIIDWQSL